ncbi:Tachykinin-like peptides receptor 86C [Amphibalanus amphitrite]|uniref:Tachykinin-like peptides receptor 86C n=1 Tax=Amphibalanus amphitrite TaxID=1232801 RepID=A0A6A4W688_AMPAM|nr:Tachykinin-like peptides receptor 86C [Amphibalanus amphitrite]
MSPEKYATLWCPSTAAMTSELSAGCCPDLGNVTCELANESACSAGGGAAAEGRSFDMPWWASLSWTVAFVVMLAIAIGGNSIVCWIILGHRHMRTVTNYFLVNLSVANLLMSCLNCTFNFVYMVNADWPFGLTYCIINNFFANFTVSASVLTLMAVAMER